MTASEQAMQAYEAQLTSINQVYNQMEALLLEMRHIIASSKEMAEGIDKQVVREVIGRYEDIMNDIMYNEASYTSIQGAAAFAAAGAGASEAGDKLRDKLNTLTNAFHDLQSRNQDLCGSYYSKLAAQKAAFEAELDTTAGEQDADGAGDEDRVDHTVQRKLKKADRMRLIQKNKEEGNELFKDNNLAIAVLRYQKAVGHIKMLFDQSSGSGVKLTPEEQSDVTSVQVTVHNNLALCYSKLDQWEQVLIQANHVLQIDARNKKALYRRGCYYENKRDYDAALLDYKQCTDMVNGGDDVVLTNEDKLIVKAMERVKKEIQKLKDKEKKMWGKAFA
jgi:heat shock protein 4